MSQFVQVPIDRLQPDVLAALLEEFASRDGTDYGNYELTLDGKVGELRRQLESSKLLLLYDADSQEWDLLPVEEAQELLQ